MAKRTKLWVVGALLLVVGGSVIASNMGFKFVPNMNTSGFTYTISIPLNHNYTNAASVLSDMSASGCNPTRITKVLPSAGGKGTVNWVPAGGIPGGNFTVNTGTTGFDGFKVVSTGSCTTWVVVGSHNPAFSYNFSTPNVSYLVSIPYHTTATNAQDLLTQIGPSATRVTRILPSAGGKGTVNWVPAGGIPGGNFTVNIGEAYLVAIAGATSWVPAHY